MRGTNLLQKYKHAWALSYFLLYMLVFHFLEQHITSNFYVIHMKIDDYIPFCEYFILPYMAWFPYVAAGVIFLMFTDVEEYKKLLIFLYTGMTIFLVISAVFPNGHMMRPVFFEHNNVFTSMVKTLYVADTETNVFPSIHVYNAIGIHCAVSRSKKLASHKWLQNMSLLLVILIILATLFLKQHSVSDDLASFLMVGITYRLVYEPHASIFGKKYGKSVQAENTCKINADLSEI